MLDAKEMKYNRIKIDRRIEFIWDDLLYDYHNVKIVREFQWLVIYVLEDISVAKVTVTYETLIDSNYNALIKQIKKAVKDSFEYKCTIPFEYENPNV